MNRRITRKLDISPSFRDFDMMGVVHNSVYFVWFELGRLQIMNEVVSFTEAARLDIAVAVRKNFCEYEKAVREGDELTLITRHIVRENYDGKLEFTHELVGRNTKILYARGECICTLIRPSDGSLLREWRGGLWQKYLSIK